MTEPFEEIASSDFDIEIVTVLPSVYNVFLNANDDIKEGLKQQKLHLIDSNGHSFPLSYDAGFDKFVAYAVQGTTEQNIRNGSIEVQNS